MHFLIVVVVGHVERLVFVVVSGELSHNVEFFFRQGVLQLAEHVHGQAGPERRVSGALDFLPVWFECHE